MIFKEPGDEILFTPNQYRHLIKAAIATSSISLLSSLCITIAFIYLHLKQPDRANRVSLRCVFSASLMNLMYTAFNLGIMLAFGDTLFCKVSSILNIFSQIMSGAFLTIVGINLVLVFVLNVHYTAKQLERFYYPGAFVYGLIAVSVPISQIIDDKYYSQPYRCYYFVNYYQLFGNTNLFWMWHYAFIFLSIVIATACSVIALIKLVREHNNSINRFIHVTSDSQTVNTTNNIILQQRLKYQSNVFTKVVSRCIIYPLVPLICNIWGFALQLILARPDIDPKYYLSLMSIIFTCIQGFFVALVFFSDPTMTKFISERWNCFKQKPVEERCSSDGQIEVIQMTKPAAAYTRGDSVDTTATCKMEQQQERLSIIMTPNTPISFNSEQISASSTLVEPANRSQRKRQSTSCSSRFTFILYRLLVKCGVYTP